MTDTQASSSPVVLTEREGRVATVTLNRPERLNALNHELLVQFTEAIEALHDDDDIHAVVLTGAGRAFSSGADLGGMQQTTEQDRNTPERATSRNIFDRLQEALETFPKPLIAAVNGLGVGFGFTVLGYCDFAYIAEGAKLRTPFSQLGLCPEASSSYLFPLKMGWAAASRALMLGEWFTAQDVVDTGLAQKVVPGDALMSEAMALAQQFADCPLQSLKATKQLMLSAHLPHIQAGREGEMEAMRGLLGTPANKEAVKAFFARESKRGR